ncbi:MAG TPA: rRNA maturation RNase YbeY [Cryomorphaceae bacterium]|nr:rRNA maturation RNase YbeY [Cryomorphaceae bacterium]
MVPQEVDIASVFSCISQLYPEQRLGKIQVHWLSDEELLEINKAHLDHDYYTDIITFDYSTPRKISGELFISVDRVRDNAVTHGSSVNQEFHRVVAHGVLHLLGFKDKTGAESKVMREKENEVLQALGI